jgi:Tol biopolymer transport system component
MGGGPGRRGDLVALLASAVLSGLSGSCTDQEATSSDSSPAVIAFSADIDGVWDFYRGDADVFVMREDRSGLRNLTGHPANDFSPEWSPDGTRIAFRSDRDGNHEIYVMEADGSHPVNLTRSPQEDRSPEWSPDGTRIAFSSERGGERDIFVLGADGG